MIKLSTKTRYGLRILMQIALDNRQGRLSRGRNIAAEQRITAPYMEQIMIPLKTARLVKTRRGCRGGYELGRSPGKITILDVIKLFEGARERQELFKRLTRRRSDVSSGAFAAYASSPAGVTR